MAAHIERIGRFENVIFKQQEEINDRMAEMLGLLLKELTASRTLEQILIKEDARPIDKCVMEPGKHNEEEPPKGIDTKKDVERKTDDKSTKRERESVTRNEEDEPAGGSSSHAVGYYLKHRINEKLIEGFWKITSLRTPYQQPK
ncbi:hypothetical protein Tco_0586538 [Tanacetum coccineum]